jgi:hypothetical protein
MTQLDVTPPGAADVSASTLTTAASHEAYLNRQANLQALGLSQPLIARPRALPRDVEWVYARDGALSAKLGGEWWSGCSVPMESARVLLRNLHVGGTACYLRPSHAAELVVALRTLAANQAVVAVVPDVRWFHLALHCHDFGEDIRGNRLWFAVGASWSDALRKIFDDHPALPIPTQLIKTPLLEHQEADGMISAVQRVFAEITPRREALLKTLQERPRRYTSSSVKRLCVVAPSLFRLWDDAGATLANVLKQPRASTDPVDCRTHDPDDPCSSGPLAITLAARLCDALVVADRARDHLAPFVPPMVSVITWVTRDSAIPRFQGVAARDALMLGDPRWLPLARGMGWPEHRLVVAQWPVQESTSAEASPKRLAIIADTIDASAPAPALDLSSHRLLWDLIHRELLDDPFAAAPEVEAYLTHRMRRLGVQPENFDRRRFLDHLIVPAYQQGLARLLLREKLPLRLHGRGWQQLTDFASHASGPVGSQDELKQAAHDAVLVHAWPRASAHPIDSLGQRVLRQSMNASTYVKTARRMLAGMTPPATQNDPLTSQKILTLL